MEPPPSFRGSISGASAPQSAESMRAKDEWHDRAPKMPHSIETQQRQNTSSLSSDSMNVEYQQTKKARPMLNTPDYQRNSSVDQLQASDPFKPTHSLDVAEQEKASPSTMPQGALFENHRKRPADDEKTPSPQDTRFFGNHIASVAQQRAFQANGIRLSQMNESIPVYNRRPVGLPAGKRMQCRTFFHPKPINVGTDSSVQKYVPEKESEFLNTHHRRFSGDREKLTQIFWGDINPNHPYVGPSRLESYQTQQGSNLETATKYSYEPLKYSDSIRLLRIEDGFGSSLLRCKLLTARLNSNRIEYEAISYVWGDAKNQVDLLTSGGFVKVTKSLYDALTALVLPGLPRYVWADAICIDQENIEERSSQVRLMRSIYSKAQNVLLWLGKDLHNEAIETFSAICCIASGGELDGKPVGKAGFRSNGVPSTLIDDVRGQLAPEFLLTSESRQWERIATLFNQAWFWRVWCIQEIALAQSALMVWGTVDISWAWVGLAAARIRTNHYQVLRRYQMPGIFNAYLMYRISRGKRLLKPLKFSFTQLLSLTRQFESSDPRDRIFGLTGIPTTDSQPGRGQLFIQADYKLSLLEVYRMLALKDFEKSDNLTLLTSVQHGDEIDRQWPSWIPGWEKAYSQSLEPLEFNASSHSACGLKPRFIFSTMEDVLVVEGLEIEPILDCLPKRTGRFQTNYLDELIQQTPEKLLQLLETRDGQNTLVMTLTAGKNWYGLPVGKEDTFLEDFATYVKMTPSYEKYSNNFKNLSNGDKDRFEQAVGNAYTERRLFFTSSGRLGLGPAALRAGDRVCVLYGGAMPFILRPDGLYYSLVGECYVQDLMRGQAINMERTGQLKPQLFNIR